MERNLIDYIKAITNLYGIIHKDKLIEIYNGQNEEQISAKELRKIMNKSLAFDCFAFIHGDHFVRLSIEPETCEAMLGIQKGKPHYIPEREELLKYTDLDYFEASQEYEELQEFLKTCFLIRKRQAVEFSKEIRHCCRSFVTFHDLMGHYWAQRRFNIRNRLKAQEFLFLLSNLRYNTRAWELNGHTLMELLDVVDEREIERLMSYGLEENYFPAINQPSR